MRARRLLQRDLANRRDAMSESRRASRTWIDQDHIRDWMRTNNATVADPEIQARFLDYIETLCWFPTKLDWREVEGASRQVLAEESEVLSWARSRRIGRHPYVLVAHSPREPALVAEFEAVLTSIDLLVWMVPHPHYLCGCETLDPLSAVVEDFLEYDGVETLIGR